MQKGLISENDYEYLKLESDKLQIDYKIFALLMANIEFDLQKIKIWGGMHVLYQAWCTNTTSI